MNSPTVEELLHQASREVRAIMWDVTALDGPGLAAGWPAFAANAGMALAAVPLPDEPTRLLIHRTAGPRLRSWPWGPPVHSFPDPHLVTAGKPSQPSLTCWAAMPGRRRLRRPQTNQIRFDGASQNAS